MAHVLRLQVDYLPTLMSPAISYHTILISPFNYPPILCHSLHHHPYVKIDLVALRGFAKLKKSKNPQKN